jgi:hypothetical protein
LNPNAECFNSISERAPVRQRDNHRLKPIAICLGEKPIQHHLGTAGIQVGNQMKYFEFH